MPMKRKGRKKRVRGRKGEGRDDKVVRSGPGVKGKKTPPHPPLPSSFTIKPPGGKPGPTFTPGGPKKGGQAAAAAIKGTMKNPLSGSKYQKGAVSDWVKKIIDAKTPAQAQAIIRNIGPVKKTPAAAPVKRKMKRP
jgi:hypothetical protein